MNTPGENAANSLWTESLGRWPGEMWVNRVAVVMIPVRPGTLTTATRVTQHTPTFGPRTQSTGNRGTTPQGGVNRHLMLQPPKQPGPEFKFARGHGTRGRPQHRFFGLTVGHG